MFCFVVSLTIFPFVFIFFNGSDIDIEISFSEVISIIKVFFYPELLFLGLLVF